MNFVGAGCRKVQTFQSATRQKAQKFVAAGLMRLIPLRLCLTLAKPPSASKPLWETFLLFFLACARKNSPKGRKETAKVGFERHLAPSCFGKSFCHIRICLQEFPRQKGDIQTRF
jgi:hypothetical protein